MAGGSFIKEMKKIKCFGLQNKAYYCSVTASHVPFVEQIFDGQNLMRGHKKHINKDISLAHLCNLRGSIKVFIVIERTDNVPPGPCASRTGLNAEALGAWEPHVDMHLTTRYITWSYRGQKRRSGTEAFQMFSISRPQGRAVLSSNTCCSTITMRARATCHCNPAKCNYSNLANDKKSLFHSIV